MSGPVVTDTGPLIHLSQADALHLLGLIGEIYVPETVLGECESTDLSALEFTAERVEYDPESTYPRLDPGETPHSSCVRTAMPCC